MTELVPPDSSISRFILLMWSGYMSMRMTSRRLVMSKRKF